MKFKEAVTYDDMLIVPQYSDIESRKEVDIGNNLGHRKFRIPVIASPMDTVTQADMAIAMYRSGGLGVLHRYNTITDQQNMARKVIDHTEWSGNVAAAIGVTGEYLKRAEALVSVGVDVLCVDVAHGHHALMKKALTTLREAFDNHIYIMAGNVCTLEGINDLADKIKFYNSQIYLDNSKKDQSPGRTQLIHRKLYIRGQFRVITFVNFRHLTTFVPRITICFGPSTREFEGLLGWGYHS